jgi:hypothetical protein
LKHSELGISAFIVGLIGILLLLGYIGIVVVFRVQNPNGPQETTDWHWLQAGVLTGMVAGVVGFVGTILALFGLVVGTRKRLYAWFGLGASLLPIVGCVGLSCLFLSFF